MKVCFNRVVHGVVSFFTLKVMNFLFKIVFLFLIGFSIKPASATVYNVKTIGEEFTPDTVYANVGDSIKFIIGIGHDVLEITDSAYVNNAIIAYPGGFSYAVGTFYFLIDSSQNYYYTCTYHMASSQMKGVIIADGSNSVNEPDLKDFISIFPNPTTGTLNVKIECKNEVIFRIWNVNGKLELTGTLSFSGKINVSSLISGFYMIEIILPDRKKCFNFIKQ